MTQTRGLEERVFRELQDKGSKVELFPPNLAGEIRVLNDKFIRAQQTLGLKITYPSPGAEWRGKKCHLRGTFINPPGDNVVAITYVGGEWWPQLSPVRVIPEGENEWEVEIDFGITGLCKVYIIRASELGMELIRYFRKLVFERDRAIARVAVSFNVSHEAARLAVSPTFWGFSMARLPKGMDMEDCITLDVKSTKP